MNDILAVLVIEFEDTVDRISRAMFTERMVEQGWKQDGHIASVWTIEFEPRSRITMRDTTRSFLQLACQYARIEMNQIRAVAHYGEDEPTQIPLSE
ncbi:MAG: hypothetical protein K8I27_11520 [Planctomycetes bacterium]|nr:hypothetical protein [Planctomycetota bacterium]